MCGLCLSRRTLLTSLPALGASALLPNAGAYAQTAASSSPHRIDVHYHHVAPAWIADAEVSNLLPPLAVKQAQDWTPERGLEEMDRNGVATAVCSVSNPGIWFGDVEHGRRLARECNEYAARLGRDHPGRFALFAALPLPDTEGSLREIAYAYDVLKADGVGLFTSYRDKWLADPAFATVFEELNRRKAAVYVHPIGPACCRNLIPGMPAAVIEYPIDTTRAIMDWVMMKSTARYPDIRIIFSHAGGLITAGVGRLTVLIDTQEALRRLFSGDLQIRTRQTLL